MENDRLLISIDFSFILFNIHHDGLLLMEVADIGKTEKLDKIYFCPKCRKVFLFKADIEHHWRAFFGHDEIDSLSL